MGREITALAKRRAARALVNRFGASCLPLRFRWKDESRHHLLCIDDESGSWVVVFVHPDRRARVVEEFDGMA